jgi:hypothetical protein
MRVSRKTDDLVNPGRRRWQWTIRGMLALTLAMSLPVALYVNHDNRPSARAVAALRKSGNAVGYDYQKFGATLYEKIARLAGEDYFGSVDSITFSSEVGQEELETLSQFPKLRELKFYGVGTFTGDNWQPLTNSKRLEKLNLSGQWFGDDEIEFLQSMSQLQELELDGSLITDEGLKKLARFTKLRWLRVVEARTSPEGLAALRAALPNCRIEGEGHPNLAAILKMPDGRQMKRFAGKITFRISINGRTEEKSNSPMCPGDPRFSDYDIPDVTGTAQITVDLGGEYSEDQRRYSGSAPVELRGGVPTQRFVDVVMNEIESKEP